MNKICTTIEQSQKLIELGIDVNTADMMWDDWNLIDEGWKLSVGYYPEIEKDYGRKCYPAWSLVALLNILPVGTETHKQTYDSIECYYVEVYNNGKYFCTDRYVNLLDACVKMIFALKQRNLL